MTPAPRGPRDLLRDLLSDLAYRWRALTRRAAAERDLDDEIRFHVDGEAARLVREGASPDDARRRARLALGGVEQVKERTRDARGVQFAEHLLRDFAHAVRLALKQPGFALVVVLSLALGLGATTTVFNLTWNILFAPVRVSHPEQLVALARADRDGRTDSFSWAEFQALRETPGAGAFVAWRGASAIGVETLERRESINIHFVDGDYFALVGVRPLSGRLITPDDDARQAPVVVLSAAFAGRLFPGEPNVVGQTVQIRRIPFTVVGVMPPSFRGLEFPAWFTAAIPMGAVSLLGASGPGRDNHGIPFGVGDDRATDQRAYQVVGRLAVEPERARAALSLTFQRCCAAAAAGARERLEMLDARRGIAGGKNDIRRQARLVLAILLAGTSLVLVVVCCNIASLVLVRASVRQREIAVRLSLGASRARLVSQLVIESVPLALLGAAGALVFATWATSAFVHNLPADLDSISATIGGQSWPAVVAFTAAATAACVLAFAVYPAVRATRQPLAQALRLDTRASRTRGQGTVARGVVMAQLAVSVVLVTAAALLAATLDGLVRVDGGFASDHMLLTTIESRSTPYEQAGVAPVHEEIVRRVRGVPGVRAATITTNMPLFGGSNWFVTIGVPGYTAPGDKPPSVNLVATIPGFFDVAGMRLLSGRDFAEGDRPGAEPVAIVNAEFQRRYFQGADAPGRTFGVALRGDTLTTVRVVGVAANAKYQDLRESPEPLLYVPLVQAPGVWSSAQLVARSEGEPAPLTRAVVQAITTAAPGINPRRARTMESQRDQATTVERLAARLAAFVSAMALVLSAVGLYGVVAYSVSRRTSEIGIRLALGARTGAVLWLVARETLVLVGVGVAAGIPLSLAATGAMRSFLFGVSAHDPRAAVLAVLLLGTAGMVASLVPARRATRIDPKIALGAD